MANIPDINQLRERFYTFAETECKSHSAFYYRLSKKIAGDDLLLHIASFAAAGQTVPNIFLAVVHYLLLKNPDDPLAVYYPSIHKADTPELPFNMFRDFCLQHTLSIKNIISTRIVQTNVINRCAYLMPVFSKIIALEQKPATLIDIGTNAGLTLNFDRYEYWYNDQKKYGNSNVVIKSELIGDVIPPFILYYNLFQKSVLTSIL